MYKEDTITAIATPAGEGGIAIVRMSGPDAERIAKEIFSRSTDHDENLRSHVLYHGIIRNPGTQEVLDDTLLTIMRKPRSYTGEDVVEVHCHGGPFVARAILELVLSQGARYAEPGEFTKRAFLNGRLDLAQAEAVLDLIRARTDEGRKLALGQVRGELSNWIRDLREELIDLLAQVEAAIDFPEEEIELLKPAELATKIEELAEKISRLIASYDWGRLFRDGARVCILGRPNVGKSSILNVLLGEDRAIVTAVPGTTRDVIEEGIDLAGLPVVLWDTAGVRAAESEVEGIGVDFTFKYLEKADAALVVLDGSVPLAEEDKLVLSAVRFRRHLVVINKDDLPQRIDLRTLDEVALRLKRDFPVLRISAKSGSGLNQLKKTLRELLLGVVTTPEIVLTNIRHKASLERCERSLNRALDTVKRKISSELVAVDLQDAKEALEEIIGLVSNENILERIFTKFCIGK